MDGRTIHRNAVWETSSPWPQLQNPARETTNKITAPGSQKHIPGGRGGAGRGPRKLSSPTVNGQTQPGVRFLQHGLSFQVQLDSGCFLPHFLENKTEPGRRYVVICEVAGLV